MNKCEECQFSGFWSGDTRLRCGREAGSPICEDVKCSLPAKKVAVEKVAEKAVVEKTEEKTEEKIQVSDVPVEVFSARDLINKKAKSKTE